MTGRSFYSNTIRGFLAEEKDSILGKLTKNNPFELKNTQSYAWQEEIEILKDQLHDYGVGRILLEYTIPRMGKRVDAVILYKGLVMLLEFKVGDDKYQKATFDQVLDYALDLKNFQENCEKQVIVPIAVPTEAPEEHYELQQYEDGVLHPMGANRNNIANVMNAVFEHYEQPDFDYDTWENAAYRPTPTIIEAAQALYNHHHVEEISRSDANAHNLTVTSDAIKGIISKSKKLGQKSIVFVTGVPGAGKTLVGLNLASLYSNENGVRSVFLSGNGPLVNVLQEALARDKVQRERKKDTKCTMTKEDAKREIETFVQIIHTYRDEYVGNDRKPREHVAIFDESQRCWTKEQLSRFMKEKKGIVDFNYSEPEFLISTMDRLDWCVVVCLVGGGQEINTGEAGMPEWFDSLHRRFRNWHVYTADNIKKQEYLHGRSLESLITGLNVKIKNDLYLETSMRSFRSEKVSSFVECLLDNDIALAQETYEELKGRYPIRITRNLETAKAWVREKSRGTERYGVLASSTAARLKPCGVVYDKSIISPENWFLNRKEDIRSSCFLEAVASEFQTQGLELDYAIVAWDADFRIENDTWKAYKMSFHKELPDWSPVQKEERILFMKNAYRVLLTRARQGFIIFIPEGSDTDITRKHEYYDATFEYLKKIGIPVI